jgi:hypothetical protein
MSHEDKISENDRLRHIPRLVASKIIEAIGPEFFFVLVIHTRKKRNVYSSNIPVDEVIQILKGASDYIEQAGESGSTMIVKPN